MSKEEKPAPTKSPYYCAMYPRIAEICREHGYAAAVHGSMVKDFDIICIPWVEDVSSPEVVIDELQNELHLKGIPENPGLKPHGRKVWTLTFSWGSSYLDLGFMPIGNTRAGEQHD